MPRTNFLSGITDDQLKAVYAESSSVADMLRALGIHDAGARRTYLRRRLEHIGLSWTDMTTKGRALASYASRKKALPTNEEMFRDGSGTSRATLRSRARRQNLIAEVCAECMLGANWNGKRLVMVLDHIDGRPTNNALSNLRFLCPNCNSQQPTFSRGETRPVRTCPDCGKTITNESTRCSSCATRESYRTKQRVANPKKIEWPSVEKLLEMIHAGTYTSVGRAIGVSIAAVKKHLRRCGVTPPAKLQYRPT